MSIILVILISVVLSVTVWAVISHKRRVWAEIKRQKAEIIAIIEEALGEIPKAEATARRAEKSVEIAKEKQAILVERPAPTVKKIARFVQFWAGIILSFAGLGYAWLFALMWGVGLGGAQWPEQHTWYQLFAFTLFGLLGAIPGALLIRKGIASYLLTKPADGRASNWWWFLPVILGFIGGIICWVKYKNVNWRQARNMLTAGILLTFIFTIPVLAGNVGFSRDILSFSDNFEDGNANGWKLQRGWQVVSENGNYVLEGQGQDFQRAWPRVTSRENYILEADFELLSGLFQFDVRSSGSKASYILWVKEGAVSLGKEASPKPINLDDSKADIGLKRWHTIGIALEGGSIKVYIDHELKIDYWDKEPLPAGTFGIMSHPGSQVRVDNIKVTPTSPLPPPTPPPTPTPTSFALSGFVRESGTNAPISGAKITVIDHNSLKGPWVQLGAASTDGEGHYVVSGLSSGTCAVQGQARGYATEWFDGIYAKDQATPLSITAPGERSNIDFTLERGGSISGKVIADASFDSIANLDIFALDYLTNEWIAGVNTSSDGTYTLSGLPAGTYRVRASPSNNKLPYADEFYNSTYDYGAAQQVIVSTGKDTADIKFSLAPAGSISGVVRNADGSAPLANVSVECLRPTDGQSVGGATTDSQGNYTISGVPYGDYTVRAPGGGKWGTGDGDLVQEYYNEQSRSGQAKRVTVASGVNPTNVNFTLSTGGSISGRVIADIGQNGIANLHVYAEDYSTGEWMSGTNTRADGTYTLNGLPAGTYRVRAVPSNNMLPYADEFYNNTYDYGAAQQVIVSIGKDTADVKFSLAPGGTISGVVRNANGSAPLANVSVECYRIISGRWESWGTTTDSQGNYTISGVPYGDFGVRARGGGGKGTGDGDFVQEYYNEKSRQAQAELVTVASGVNPTNVNFTLSTGGSISGKVIADIGQSGIANLHVKAEDLNTGEWMSGTNTRADGTYTLNGLPAGTYRVKAAPSNNKLPYADKYYNNTYDYGAVQQVTVTVGQDTAGINFSLAPGGSISGVVRNTDGSAPLANVSVECYRIVNGRWESWGTITDSQGKYAVYGLPYGDYTVRAPGGGRSGAGDGDLVQEYYVEKSRQAQAELVTVASGVNPTNVNFTLSTGGSISGKVIADIGQNGIANLHVYAEDYNTNEWMSGTNTRVDGTYTLHGLPARTYRVKAVPSNTKLPYADEYYNNTYDYRAAQQVKATAGQDTRDINFALEVGGSISGRVTDEAGNPIANADAWADYWAGSTAGGTRTDADGHYTIKNLPSGDYRVQAKASGRVQKSYNNAWTYDKAMPVHVTAPNDAAGINFSLGPGGTISGTVKDKVSGKPLANVSVDCGRVDGEGGGGATTDQNGNYTITGLPFGRYKMGSPSDKRWGPGDDNYARQFYSSKLDWGSADMVTISAQNPNAANINFSLVALLR